MEDFDRKFENLVTPQKSEIALKEFGNWILGLSIGLCAFMVTQSTKIIDPECSWHKSMYIVILILAMINAFIAGFNKYFILKRDSNLAANQDILKSIAIEFEEGKIDLAKAESEWSIVMNQRVLEFKNIVPIGKILRLSLLLTVLTSLLTGLYIILTI